MGQSPSREAYSRRSYFFFMEPKCLLRSLQVPATGPSLEPDESNLQIFCSCAFATTRFHEVFSDYQPRQVCPYWTDVSRTISIINVETSVQYRHTWRGRQPEKTSSYTYSIPLRFMLMLSFYIILGLPTKWSLPLRFPDTNFVCVSHLLDA
jgi:hypothetical protein